MEKISIKINDDLLNKMKERMDKNGSQNLSQCARELIELALRIEAMADQSEDKNTDENDISPVLLELLKTHLTWSLETRFLMQFLLKNFSEMEANNATSFIATAREKASEAVQVLIDNSKTACSD